MFDLRSAESGKYIKVRFAYTVEVEATKEPAIKSVTAKKIGSWLQFTVVLSGGNYNRVRCGLSESIADNITTMDVSVTDDYTEYSTFFCVDAPKETTTYYFDVRDSETNKYLKEYYILEYVV